MALFTNFGIGVSTYGDAHRLIKKHKLWGYVLLPGLINIILFIFVFIAGWHYSDVITHWLFDVLGLDKEPTGFFKYILIALHFILSLIFKIVFILFYLAIYRYIVLIIMSPALALLSERAEQALLGTNYPFGPFEWSEKIGVHKIASLLLKLSETDSRYTACPLLLKESNL